MDPSNELCIYLSLRVVADQAKKYGVTFDQPLLMKAQQYFFQFHILHKINRQETTLNLDCGVNVIKQLAPRKICQWTQSVCIVKAVKVNSCTLFLNIKFEK